MVNFVPSKPTVVRPASATASPVASAMLNKGMGERTCTSGDESEIRLGQGPENFNHTGRELVPA